MRKEKSIQVGQKYFTLSLLKARVLKSREFSRSHVTGSGGGGNQPINVSTTHTDHQEYWVEPVDGGSEEHISSGQALLVAREGHVIHHLSLAMNDGQLIPMAMQNENTGQLQILPLDRIRQWTGMNGSGSVLGDICFIGGLLGAGLIWINSDLPWWFAMQVAAGGWFVSLAFKYEHRRRLGRKEFENLYARLRIVIEQHGLTGLYQSDLLS